MFVINLFVEPTTTFQRGGKMKRVLEVLMKRLVQYNDQLLALRKKDREEHAAIVDATVKRQWRNMGSLLEEDDNPFASGNFERTGNEEFIDRQRGEVLATVQIILDFFQQEVLSRQLIGDDDYVDQCIEVIDSIKPDYDKCNMAIACSALIELMKK